MIQRKLVRVLTPSTSVDGNIGPDAIHLLAIKEVFPASTLSYSDFGKVLHVNVVSHFLPPVLLHNMYGVNLKTLFATAVIFISMSCHDALSIFLSLFYDKF